MEVKFVRQIVLHPVNGATLERYLKENNGLMLKFMLSIVPNWAWASQLYSISSVLLLLLLRFESWPSTAWHGSSIASPLNPHMCFAMQVIQIQQLNFCLQSICDFVAALFATQHSGKTRKQVMSAIYLRSRLTPESNLGPQRSRQLSKQCAIMPR